VDDADAAFLRQRNGQRPSVTVSMAADSSGRFRVMLRVRRVARLTSRGRILRMGGDEQDVVECQGFLQKSHGL
jgi:hypothetical protein